VANDGRLAKVHAQSGNDRTMPLQNTGVTGHGSRNISWMHNRVGVWRTCDGWGPRSSEKFLRERNPKNVAPSSSGDSAHRRRRGRRRWSVLQQLAANEQVFYSKVCLETTRALALMRATNAVLCPSRSLNSFVALPMYARARVARANACARVWQDLFPRAFVRRRCTCPHPGPQPGADAKRRTTAS